MIPQKNIIDTAALGNIFRSYIITITLLMRNSLNYYFTFCQVKKVISKYFKTYAKLVLELSNYVFLNFIQR